ncbi:MAG: DNA primase [Hyphomicrobium sp.]|nr:MAG: DNA primase [Hyphomicrobium sp.]PPC99754.1 MAG: DNA primase [Hyphomicrobium sp.]
MRFSPNFLDEIRARLPVSQVVGRKVALKKAGREYKGLSPFKVEKSPSFTVNDQKGFYHCFASGEHGDIFTFVMKTEGLEFPEAVERLASEAGIAMPAPTERSVEQDDQRARLYKLLEISARFFEEQLKSAAGSEARRYLDKRGLHAETRGSFRIGFAPHGRGSLRELLRSQGFSLADMATSGMLIAGDDIPEPYDRFRNRIMFPILDLKGRVIAFGGRALDKDAPAKYLNSPETPLFHKGHVLFNASRARPIAHDKGRIIAVEGYMDVAALHEAGFPEAVAPLGTALTEDQIKLLWRMVPVPILCFDGDAAGQKAAHRAIDTVMPNLKPGMSVAFAFLPDGLDPDDLIRQRGAQAMTDVLAKTRPLIDVLWDREVAAGPLSTPEQRAALEARLRGLAAGITDPLVRAHYERELRDRLYQMGRRSPQARTGVQSGNGGGNASSSYARPVGPVDWRHRERARLEGRPERGRNWSYGTNRFGEAQNAQAAASPELSRLSQTVPIREALILKTLLNHPWLIDEHSEQLAEINFTSEALSALRDQILSIHASTNSLDTATLATQLTKTGVAKVVDLVARTMTHNSDRFAEPEASATEVEAAWNHILALHQRQDALERMLKSAEEAWYRDCSEETQARLLDIKRQIAIQSAMDHIDGEGPKPDEIEVAALIKRAL